MNPAWKRRTRRVYARKVLEACTGPIEPRKTFRVRWADLAASIGAGVIIAAYLLAILPS